MFERDNIVSAVEMTRREAEELSSCLNRFRSSLVLQIKTIEKKRSWSNSEKAMAIGERHLTLEKVSAFQDKLQQAHHIGGY